MIFKARLILLFVAVLLSLSSLFSQNDANSKEATILINQQKQEMMNSKISNDPNMTNDDIERAKKEAELMNQGNEKATTEANSKIAGTDETVKAPAMSTATLLDEKSANEALEKAKAILDTTDISEGNKAQLLMLCYEAILGFSAPMYQLDKLKAHLLHRPLHETWHAEGAISHARLAIETATNEKIKGIELSRAFEAMGKAQAFSKNKERADKYADMALMSTMDIRDKTERENFIKALKSDNWSGMIAWSKKKDMGI